MRRERLTHMKKRLREATRAQRELEKRMFHLKTLYDVSREIGSLIDTQAIIKNLLMMVVGTFGVERGLILIVEVRENRIETMTQRGFDDAASAALSQAVHAGFPTKVQGATGTVVLSESDDSGLLSSLNLRVWIPFDVNERLRGGIGLGEKLTGDPRSEEHTSELQSPCNLVCRLLLEKKKIELKSISHGVVDSCLF